MEEYMEDQKCVGGIVSTGQRKHLNLHSAINDMDSIREHLSELIISIDGNRPTTTGPKEGMKQPPVMDPTLNDILTDGANRIHTKSDQIHKMIDEVIAILR